MLHYNNLISSWENIVRAPGATCWTGLDCRIGDLLVTLMCAYVAQLKLEIDISDVDCGSVSIYSMSSGKVVPLKRGLCMDYL